MSRLPSSRGSSTAGGRSAATSQRRPGGVLVQSPKSDIYVAMLGVSLAAILIATILMAVLLSRYGFSTKAVTQTQGSPALTRIA